MKIIGFDYESDEDKEKILKKSKNIICPICMENARISVEDFIISLYDCRNKHRTDKIQLNEFEKTQHVDQSKIICENCKENNKSESTDNKFYICFACKKNLCIICKKKHDKSHKIFNYDDKDFYCKIHSEVYIGYCNDCKSDICNICQNDHRKHYIIQYGNIMPDIESSKKQLEILNIRIKILKTDIKNIIKKLNHLNYNLDNYYEIYNNMVTNFDIGKKNYSSLQNINDMQKYNDVFVRIITEIINDTNIKTKFSELSDLLNKMSIIQEKKEENKINEEEKNTGKNENIIEDKNYNNIKRYNPSDDKYENFKINEIKELKSFEVKYEIDDILILHDRRLLTVQSYKNEKGDKLYKIMVYVLNNGIICNINYDIEYIKQFYEFGMNEIIKVFQMNDDNIIIFIKNTIKIFRVKRKSIEEIYSIKLNFRYVFYLFCDKFITIGLLGCLQFLSYENNKINEQNAIKKQEYYFFKEACGLNENEIVLLYNKEGILTGSKDYLLFYDIKKYKDIKKLRLGHYDSDYELLLLNDNNLIVILGNKLNLINTKSRVIIQELNTGCCFRHIISLNNNSFILYKSSDLFQYKLENSNITFVDKKEINEDLFFNKISKYPDNQLIAIKNNKIYIYG